MTLTRYLVGVAYDYTVCVILTSYLVGVAYDYTVYHFENCMLPYILHLDDHIHHGGLGSILNR